MHLGPDAIERLLPRETRGENRGEGDRLSLRELDHLLTCTRCRRTLGAIVTDLLDSDPNHPGLNAFPELPLGSELRRVIERVLKLVTDEPSPAPLLAKTIRSRHRRLLDASPEDRISLIANDVRFQDLSLAEALLVSARQSLAENPGHALHFASLAMTSVALLIASEPSSDTSSARRTQALAFCLMADAQRLQGYLDVADDLLRYAASTLRDEPLSIPERLDFCIRVSLLRQSQKRPDEAISLLERASLLAEDLGDFAKLAETRLLLGRIYLEENDFDAAIPPLREALALREDDVNHALSALDGLATAYAECGPDELLSETLQSLEALASRATALAGNRIRWSILRAVWTRSANANLLPELETCLNQFAATAPPSEAAIASLEFAWMILDARIPESPVLISAVAKRVEGLELESHLRRPLRFALQLAERRIGYFQDALLSAMTYLSHARFNPDYTYRPLPEPVSVLRWDEISQQQIEEVASIIGVTVPIQEEHWDTVGWTLEALAGVRPEGSPTARLMAGPEPESP